MGVDDAENSSIQDPRVEPPIVCSATVGFSQPGNTMGNTCDYELITIEACIQSLGDKPFFVIRTDGWSIDSVKDIESLLDQCKTLFP